MWTAAEARSDVRLSQDALTSPSGCVSSYHPAMAMVTSGQRNILEAFWTCSFIVPGNAPLFFGFQIIVGGGGQGVMAPVLSV